jgi:hypothetical protein
VRAALRRTLRPLRWLGIEASVAGGCPHVWDTRRPRLVLRVLSHGCHSVAPQLGPLPSSWSARSSYAADRGAPRNGDWNAGGGRVRADSRLVGHPSGGIRRPTTVLLTSEGRSRGWRATEARTRSGAESRSRPLTASVIDTPVKGQRDLPRGGREVSPVVATRSPLRWPPVTSCVGRV